MRGRRALRSPEALGLTLHSTQSPEERARLKVERLQTIPAGDFEWKELTQQFNQYVRLFPKGMGSLCRRCQHPKTTSGAWVHLPNPLPGERACQPDGVLCDCKGFEAPETKGMDVLKAARYVRASARRAWRGGMLPRWRPLERKMTLVYRFVQGRA